MIGDNRHSDDGAAGVGAAATCGKPGGKWRDSFRHFGSMAACQLEEGLGGEEEGYSPKRACGAWA